MAIKISFGTEKGGSGKTTTTAVMTHLIAKKHKVLAVDIDLQGNLTQLLTGIVDKKSFNGHTVLEAMKEKDAKKYILPITDNIDLLAGNTFLSTFPQYLYLEYIKTGNNIALLLKETLKQVENDYDYIVIDTPPALGEHTLNALGASDYTVIMFESSMLGYSAIGSYLTTVENVKQINPNLQTLGILRTLMDSRRSDNKKLITHVGEEFKDLCFKTVINRKAEVGRLPILGFTGNPELTRATPQYWDALKEMYKRVQNGEPA